MDGFDQLLLEAGSAIEWSFATLLALSALLYLLAHFAPRSLIRFISVPWTFQLHKATDLRYQGVLYGAFHTRLWARLTHLSLAWDQPFWFALLYVLHPAVAGAALLLLLLQALLLQSPRLAAVLGAIWLAIAALGWGLVHTLGEARAAPLAMAVLILGGLLRYFSHFFEPLPPGVHDPEHFVPFKNFTFSLRMFIVLLTGLVSEFAAGFPFRLFVVQVLWLSNALGLRTPHHGDVREHLHTAGTLHRGGWSASPVTAWMLDERRDPGRPVIAAPPSSRRLLAATGSGVEHAIECAWREQA